MIRRSITPTVQEVSKYFPVVTITGPRQSGKTTLIRHLFDGYTYHTLEDPDARQWAEEDPRDFLSSDSSGVVIDEVQNVPSLLSYIQGIVDSDRSRKFVLSGSSNLTLLKGVTQTLAGRTAVLELLPLSIGEVLSDGQNFPSDEGIVSGLFPAVRAGIIPYRLFWPNYVRTFLERDVRDILNVQNLSQFQTFVRLCAARVGGIFNASELSGEIGISVNTVLSWLNVLQASYVVYMLHPYYENTTKRLVKSPKLYFTDTGLAAYLLGIGTAEQLSRDRMAGPLFENLVVNEALKHKLNRGEDPGLFFFRNSRGEEVDLVLRRGTLLDGVEIKSSKTYNTDFAKHFPALEKTYPGMVGRKAVVYSGDMEGGNDIRLVNYLHFDRWLTDLESR